MKTALKIRMISIEAEGSAQDIMSAIDSLAQVAGSLTSGIAENGCATKAKKRGKLQAPVSTPKSTRGKQSRSPRSGNVPALAQPKNHKNS